MGQPFDIDILIDKSVTGGTFTNYDTIKGKIILKVHSDTSFSNIQVKLEGISKTMVEVLKEKKDNKTKPVYETHRLLYETQTVFPTPEIRKVSSCKNFSLIPSTYTYPFNFKIPLYNNCSKLTGITNMVQFHHKSYNAGIELVNEANSHVKTILPPSFSGMGDFAQVKYFIKVTAKRPSFYQMNMRMVEPFIFLPVDDQKLLNNDNRQSFTRRDFLLKDKYPEIVGVYEQRIPVARPFKAPPSPRVERKKSSGFFKTLFTGSENDEYVRPAHNRRTSSSSLNSGRRYDKPRHKSQEIDYSKVSPSDLHVKPINLKIGFEVRFRYPAYVIPTKFPNYQLLLLSDLAPSEFQLFNGESSGLGKIYMRYLKIELISETDVYVTSYKKSVSTKFTVYLNDRLSEKLDLADSKKGDLKTEQGKSMYELKIPKSVYHDAIIPDRVAPSFKTCNIQRQYKLLITAGFAESTTSDKVQLVRLETKINILSGMEPVLDDEDEETVTSPAAPTYSQVPSSQVANHQSHIPPASPALSQPPRISKAGSKQSSPSVSLDQFQKTSVISNPTGENALPTYEDVMNETFNQERRAFEQSSQYYQGSDEDMIRELYPS